MSDSNLSVVDIKDNKIVRIRPLHYDWKYKYEELGNWEIKARGRTFKTVPKSLIPPFSLAYKKRAISPNRILFPLKRIDWDPKGKRNPHNRGISKYIRISWDEAIDIVVNELKRIKDTYGMSAVLTQADGHGETQNIHAPHGCQERLLELLGGFTHQMRNPDSWEGWYWGAKYSWGCEPLGKQQPQTNVFPDAAENADIILYWGCDPETTPWGWQGQLSSKLCYWFTELGIKQIYICPDLNYGAAVHADKWIPILPNTDAAMMLAIAFVWINEESYDKDYISTHTYGFDQFHDYVIGKEDGISKTPKWAEGKCGVPARLIKALAREWAKKAVSIAHSNGGSRIRGPFSTEPARLEVCLLAMQGLGKPGVNQISFIEWGLFCPSWQYPLPAPVELPDVSAACMGQKALVMAVEKGLISAEEVLPMPKPSQIIPKTLIHDAILKPPIKWYGSTAAGAPIEDQFMEYHFPTPGCSRIHMIWSDTPCLTTCWNDSNNTLSAYRDPSIEFILVQHPWMENDCYFADIILPSNTKFESGKDIAIDIFSGQYHSLVIEEQCIEPLGESVTDFEVVCKIAERMGLLGDYLKGKTPDEWLKIGYETSGVARMVTWERLNNKKYWVVPHNPKWKENKAGLWGFYNDPKNNPLKTPSGKVEFASQQIVKHFPDDNERPPVPHWIEKTDSHDERQSSDRAKKYPLLVISNHGRWRLHAQLDDISWFHEIKTGKVKGSDGYLYEPCWLNPKTAEERSINHSDIIKVYNERGAVLCGAYITERLMPGVAYIDHGARYDPIIPGELDRGGAINTITPHNCTSKNAAGMATSGYLVEVEKVTMAQMEEWKIKYPKAFEREYDPASGLRFNSWVE